MKMSPKRYAENIFFQQPKNPPFQQLLFFSETIYIALTINEDRSWLLPSLPNIVYYFVLLFKTEDSVLLVPSLVI